jgi:hypothetical protein
MIDMILNSTGKTFPRQMIQCLKETCPFTKLVKVYKKNKNMKLAATIFSKINMCQVAFFPI